MKNSCVEIFIHGKKNYDIFLDIVKQELDILGIGDINAIQAFILININENVVTIGEVISRGYYIGSNASYNIKKMISNGYIKQIPSEFDKRAAYLKLTSKGLDMYNKLDIAIRDHAKTLEPRLNGKFDIEQGVSFLKNVGYFWKEILSRRM